MPLKDKYDKYIKGEMTDPESDEFTTKIWNDYEKHKRKEKWYAIVKNEKKASFNEKEKSITAARTNTNQTSFFTIKKILSIAASILILMLAGYFFIPEKIEPNNKTIASQFLETPYEYGESRKGEELLDEQRNIAGIFYSEKSYEKSAQIFQNIFKAKKGNSNDHFYQGLNFLYLKKYDLAIEQFNICKKYKDAREREAFWFLTLATIQQEDLLTAKKQLKAITKWEQDENSAGWEIARAKDAKKLLENLQE